MHNITFPSPLVWILSSMALAVPSFGLYLHWPFCTSKCPYCDFNSTVTERIDQPRWRAGLLRALDKAAEQQGGRPVDSIFFGGGTPSLMEPATVAALLERIARHWPLAADVEITLEANPGSADAARFRDFRAAGVNRLSLGVQALNDPDLQFLGRRHSVAAALEAIELARAVFPRLSFDLIYARPGQTVDSWAAELQQALALAADHLSLYQLTIEDGTAFAPAHARRDFILPDDDAAAALFDVTQELCEAAGLPAYEVSNHAVPGAECRHNLLYWQGGDYLGLGPGAHGRVQAGDGTIWATAERRAAQPWLEEVERSGQAPRDLTPLTPEQRRDELVMMGLRLRGGLDAALFARRCQGQPLEQAVSPAALRQLQEDGFLDWDGQRLQATPAGRLVLSAVTAALLNL